MKNKLVLRLFAVATSIHLSPCIRADVLIENFASSRAYPECCGQYGSYYSFESNTVQNGSGTLILSGTDCGGVYWGNGTTVMFDLRNQTKIIVRAKTSPANQSTNFHLWLHDWSGGEVLYHFPFSALNTNGFTWLTNDLMSPVWGDATNFNFAHVIAIDLIGDFSPEEWPFELEVDAISTLGPPVEYGPPIHFVSFSNRVDLFWPTGSGNGYVLQSAPTLSGTWTNESGVSITNTNYVVSKSFEDTNRFFRLSKSQTFPLRGGGRKKNADGLPEKLIDHAEEKGLDEIQSREGNALTKSMAPPTNAPPAYASYIDMSSYELHSRLWRVQTTNGAIMSEEATHLNRTWSDHTGGLFIGSYTNFSYTPPIWGMDIDFWTTNSPNWPSGIHYYWPNPLYTNGVGYPDSIHWQPLYFVSSISALYSNSAGTTQDVRTVEWSHLTHTDLHVGTTEAGSSTNVFIALQVTATNVDTVTPFGGIAQISEIPAEDISVLGESLNADGQVMIQGATRTTVNVTPIALGRSNYLYTIKRIPHQTNRLNRAYHPMYHLPGTSPIPKLETLQSSFTAGAVLLNRDDDARIKDADAPESTNSSSAYRTDDVSHLCEFKISDGPKNTNFLTRPPRLLPVFPKQFAGSQYYWLVNDSNVLNLFTYTQAQIKQVEFLVYKLKVCDGLTITSAKPMNAIFVSTVDGIDCVHEWGHACGLGHRGTTNHLGEWNYGPIANAVMAETNISGNVKINRYERNKMRAW